MPKNSRKKTNAAIASNAPRKRGRKGLSQSELTAQQGAELPEREAMSLVNANLAAPINAALALNVLSDDSTAVAIAEQNTPIDQSI